MKSAAYTDNDLASQLQHYNAQKQSHPHIGALFVNPARSVRLVQDKTPRVQSGITLVWTTDQDAGLLFNLHIASNSRIDRWMCHNVTPVTARRILPHTQYPIKYSDIRACGRYRDTVCRPNLTESKECQGHTFQVTVYVVDMNDDFDLVLGQHGSSITGR